LRLHRCRTPGSRSSPVAMVRVLLHLFELMRDALVCEGGCASRRRALC
jgi:hypothetical protein